MSVARVVTVDNIVWVYTIATDVCGHCIVKFFYYVFFEEQMIKNSTCQVLQRLLRFML
jgi:hypothetical protein